MRFRIEDLPQDILRRVTHRLESMRDLVLSEKSVAPRLGPEACPIYRPDISEPAYWEFEILGLGGTKARDREGEGSGSGFILASAGRHDIPLPHMSLAIEPPSRALEAKSEKPGEVARIIKLDTLAYAAENAEGKLLGHVGQFPPAILASAKTLKALNGISTVKALSGETDASDNEPGELKVVTEGDPMPEVKMAPWRSWAEAKRRYTKVYSAQLTALAKHAAPAWEVEDLLAQYGEGIMAGQSLTVPLLRPGKARLSGDGARAVRMSMLMRDPPVVLLEALAIDANAEINFTLDIQYEDGSAETLAFFVVPMKAPSNYRSQLPGIH